jgi:hypothetical protein
LFPHRTLRPRECAANYHRGPRRRTPFSHRECWYANPDAPWTGCACVRTESRVFFFLPNFLMFRGILVFVQCIQTRFTEDGLNFISSAILLVLSPLFLARMILLSPCPIDGYIKSKVSGLHTELSDCTNLCHSPNQFTRHPN